ncbi:MAG: methylaspartate ammonia-lyase [Deltaproteobacteria bacterium]|jgi:methylaspartate ammonia-lyase|nr:methylaspartate ammonia-lyase [Deltaproteobacteria bacterium]
MKITNLVCSAGGTGFFFDDQLAIKSGARQDGNAYVGEPRTPGFTQVRQAGQSLSIMLILEDGQVAHGDCAAVQYSGAGGRDPLFLAGSFIPVVEREIRPLLVGKEITTFREMAGKVDRHPASDGTRLHTALRYGATQAVLDAVAKSRHKLMAQVVAEEYGLKISEKPVPIFSQTGDERVLNADKIILKGAEVLPHALFNNVRDKLGERGEKLKGYVEWLARRVETLRPYPNYDPILHIDVYGTLGLAFQNDFQKIADYMAALEQAAKPFRLRIEGPVDMGGYEPQIKALKELSALLDSRGVNVGVVADEWCNTLEDVRGFADEKAGHMIQIKTPDLGGVNNSVEAVVYCKERGVGAYLGGTCNETERSAQVCAHIAMATSPDQCLAKPGMGVDEGVMIVRNEMARILALKDVI